MRVRHLCRDNLDYLGSGSTPYECLVCNKRFDQMDVNEWANTPKTPEELAWANPEPESDEQAGWPPGQGDAR